MALEVHRSSDEIEAAERARWLAELALAIEDAEDVAWQLNAAETGGSEVRELYGRLEFLRAEVDDLRRNGWATCREEIEPEWGNLLTWKELIGKSPG